MKIHSADVTAITSLMHPPTRKRDHVAAVVVEKRVDAIPSVAPDDNHLIFWLTSGHVIDHPSDRLRPRRLGIMLPSDPRIEGRELVGLEADANKLPRLQRALPFHVITSCHHHSLVITPVRAEGKFVPSHSALTINRSGGTIMATCAPITGAPSRAPITYDTIARICAERGITLSRFGREAVGDPRFVQDLRAGRTLTPRTRERIRAFIAGGCVGKPSRQTKPTNFVAFDDLPPIDTSARDIGYRNAMAQGSARLLAAIQRERGEA